MSKLFATCHQSGCGQMCEISEMQKVVLKDRSGYREELEYIYFCHLHKKPSEVMIKKFFDDKMTFEKVITVIISEDGKPVDKDWYKSVFPTTK